LTDKKKIGAAPEHMIDELIQFIKTNLDFNNETTILGEEIQCAKNRVNITQSFTGYNNFLESKVPQTKQLRTPSKMHGTSIVKQPLWIITLLISLH
jgi:hypothetical protein